MTDPSHAATGPQSTGPLVHVDRSAVSAVMSSAIGYTIIITSLATVSEVTLSIACIIAGMVAVGIGRHLSAPARASIGLHVVSAAVLAMSLTGWCATSCGSLTAYESIFGIKTAILGMGAHIFAAFLHWIPKRMTKEQGVPVTVIATAVSLMLIGASVCFLAIMVAQRGYCGTCTAAHALMVIQAILIMRGILTEPIMPLTWFTAVPFLATGALLVNAVFHHRMVPERVHDASELASYLRMNRIGSPRPSTETGMSASPIAPVGKQADDVAANLGIDDADVRRKAAEIMANLRAGQPSAPAPARAVEQPAPRVVARPTAPAGQAAAPAVKPAGPADPPRQINMANLIGTSHAPIEVVILADPRCPGCAREMAELRRFLPMLESGRICIRLNLVFRDDLGNAAATIIAATGFLGSQPMWDTLMAFMQGQSKARTVNDYLAMLPPSVDGKTIVDLIRSKRDDLAVLLTDAKNLQTIRGVRTTPAIWLHHTGRPEPSREFIGKTNTETLSLAIESMLAEIPAKGHAP